MRHMQVLLTPTELQFRKLISSRLGQSHDMSSGNNCPNGWSNEWKREMYLSIIEN